MQNRAIVCPRWRVVLLAVSPMPSCSDFWVHILFWDGLWLNASTKVNLKLQEINQMLWWWCTWLCSPVILFSLPKFIDLFMKFPRWLDTYMCSISLIRSLHYENIHVATVKELIQDNLHACPTFKWKTTSQKVISYLPWYLNRVFLIVILQ